MALFLLNQHREEKLEYMVFILAEIVILIFAITGLLDVSHLKIRI